MKEGHIDGKSPDGGQQAEIGQQNGSSYGVSSCMARTSVGISAPAASGSDLQQDSPVPTTSSAGLRGVAGNRWQLPVGLTECDCAMVWIGNTDAEALQLLQLAYSACAWICCEVHSRESPHAAEPHATSSCPPQNDGLLESPASLDAVRCVEGLAWGTQVLLKRRYFLIEKAKQATIVGILVRWAHGNRVLHSL